MVNVIYAIVGMKKLKSAHKMKALEVQGMVMNHYPMLIQVCSYTKKS